MNANSLPVSVRSALDRWFLVAVLVALALALVGGYVTYDTYVGEADTVVEQQTTGTWTVESEFDHAATVQRGTAVFTPGDRLENRQLYFTTVAPALDGTYTVNHTNTGGNPATATVELSLVVRAVEDIEGEQVVYWQTRDSLKTLDSVEIEDGGEVSTTVSTNVSAVLARIGATEEELGASPGETEVLVVADTVVEGSVAGEPFTDSRTERIEISPGRAVYRVSTDVEEQSSDEVTEQVTRTVEPSVLSLYGGPLLLLVGLFGVAILGLARRDDWLTVADYERARWEFETARDDFDEWISAFEIPESGERTVVPGESLADLVDVAIDSDRRVLEDGDRYAVVVDDLLYTYTAPPADDPLTESGSEPPQEDSDTPPANAAESDVDTSE